MSVTSEYISTERILIFRFSGCWTWDEYDEQLLRIQPLFEAGEAGSMDVIIEFATGSTAPTRTKAQPVAPQWLQIESVQYLLIAGIQQVNLSPLETARRLCLFPHEYHMTHSLEEALVRLSQLRGRDYKVSV